MLFGHIYVYNLRTLCERTAYNPSKDIQLMCSDHHHSANNIYLKTWSNRAPT